MNAVLGLPRLLAARRAERLGGCSDLIFFIFLGSLAARREERLSVGIQDRGTFIFPYLPLQFYTFLESVQTKS